MNASTHLHGSSDPFSLAGLAAAAGLDGASIVVERVTGGPPLAGALDPGAAISPASMIKVPLAAALAALWERGDLRPEDTATVSAAHLTANDDVSPFASGYTTNLVETARAMITRSDNVATNLAIDAIGRERATEYLAGLGLRETTIRRKLSGSLPLIDDPRATGRNTHPAGDAALLFRLIATGAIPGAQWLHGLLAEQQWNDKLSPGLRPGDRFAHKTGETDETSHDGGILDTEEGARYVLVVYTRLAATPATDARLARFMTSLRPLL
jgi:beta-lactamase class A